MKITIRETNNSANFFLDSGEYIGGALPSTLLGRQEGKPWSAYSAGGTFLGYAKTVPGCMNIVVKYYLKRKP